jgi:hypothetical protein
VKERQSPSKKEPRSHSLRDAVIAGVIATVVGGLILQPSGILRVARWIGHTAAGNYSLSLTVPLWLWLILAGAGVLVGLLLLRPKRPLMAHPDSNQAASTDNPVVSRGMKDRAPAPAAAESARIDSTDEDFDAWADELVRNKARTQLKVDEIGANAIKQELSNKLAQKQAELTTRLSTNDTVRPVFDLAITSLKKAIAAYNSKSGSHITWNLPDLPFDFFEHPAIGYKGTIDFEGKALWTILLDVPNTITSPYSPGEPSFPTMSIRIEQGGVKHGGAWVSFGGGGTIGNSVEVGLNSDRVPSIQGIGFWAPKGEYKSPLQLSMETLIEAQLWALSQPW